MDLSEHHWNTVLEPRGITDQALTPDRYLSYEPGDLEEIRQLVSLGKGGKLSFRTRTILSGPGLLIRRHGLIQSPSLRRNFWPPSQLRPDQPRRKDERYIFTEGYAKGIDFHPDTRDWFKKRGHLSPSFFCLEGSLKADAAQSWGWQAFNVASVTLWDSQNLTRVGDFLKRGPITFVVTDSDWESNDTVWNQAVRCVAKLRELGIPAVHVAPRPLCTKQHNHDKECKTGLDDVIASKSWDPVESMLLVPRMPKNAPLAASISANDVYRWLLAHKRRHIEAFTAEISNAIGLSKRGVRRAVDELERLGKIEFRPGERFREGGNGHWTANPNRYTLAVPETLTLGELGWGGRIGPEQNTPTEASWKNKSLQPLARATVEASTPSVVPLGCELCGKPLLRIKSTKRFCSPYCRRRQWRADQRAAEGAGA